MLTRGWTCKGRPLTHGYIDMRYSNALLEDLGLSSNTKVGYYWVDGEVLRFWSPYSYGVLYVENTTLHPYVCAALNAYTSEVYSHSGSEYDRGTLNTYIYRYGCVVIKGGPFDSKCKLFHHYLPLEVLEVMGITPTEEVTLPDHDLWELVIGDNYQLPDTHIYLVTEGKYTIEVSDAGYELRVRGEITGRVVCTGTLDQCRALNEHLVESYHRGKRYAAMLMTNTLEKL